VGGCRPAQGGGRAEGITSETGGTAVMKRRKLLKGIIIGSSLRLRKGQQNLGKN